ncbi:hypothetical protein SBA4_1280014 [Candidatus Sulfopaludibacter sp. SbA4]|nr:hypothetical protein SBA4_1280014 [Candidatus Sulfopaludibacter sp. SbA4]
MDENLIVDYPFQKRVQNGTNQGIASATSSAGVPLAPAAATMYCRPAMIAAAPSRK